MVDRARLAENLEQVHRTIGGACERSGRCPEAVRLVAVTKTVGAEAVRALFELGQRDFGENRPRNGCGKVGALAEPEARWHFIGHLQRNKVKDVLPAFGTVHSLDSVRLARQMQRIAEEQDLQPTVLLEVNISGEASKHGIEAREAPGVADEVLQMDRLRLAGLMTMAPLVEDPEETRVHFRGLRTLRERLEHHTGEDLPELSMGMSNDYAVAIEEGATQVRVGSALFRGCIEAATEA